MRKNYIAAVLLGVSVFAVSSASVSRDVAREQTLSCAGKGRLQVALAGLARSQVLIAGNCPGCPDRPQVA